MERSSLFAVILGVALFIVFSPAGIVSSEGAEFSIKPAITLSEEYDDNIYLTPDSKTSDYITRIMPSVNIHYKTPLWDWTLVDTFSWWYYAKRGRSETFNNGILTSKVNIIENFLFFDLNDAYSSVVLDPTKPSTDANLATNRSDSNNLVLSPYIRYQLTPASTLTTGYRYTNIWYKENTAVKRQMHTGFATGEYKFSPLMSVYAGVEYIADRPARIDPDNNQTTVFARALYKIDPRTTFDGNIGYRKIDFSPGSDRGRMSYDASLTYSFSEHGQTQVRAASVLSPSAQTGIYEGRSEQISAKYGDTFSVNGVFFHRKDTYLETDLINEVYGVTVGLEYKPDQRLTFKAGGKFERDKFRPGDDVRKVYGGSGEIDYQLLQKMTLVLSYNYTRQNSRITNYDYTDNVAAIQIRKTY